VSVHKLANWRSMQGKLLGLRARRAGSGTTRRLGHEARALRSYHRQDHRV